MIIDTHCHYNLSPLLENWPRYWAEAQSAGITDTVVVGADLASSQRAIEIAQQEAHLFAAIGIHPDEYTTPINNVGEVVATHHQQLRDFINRKVVAIGETGLDYFRLSDESRQTSIQQQRAAFIMHLQLAENVDLPLSIHVRDRAIPEMVTIGNAYWDTLSILKEQYHGHRPFILHCVSGPLQYIKAAVDLGGYIGVAGNVTYKNAENIRNIVQAVPPDRIVVETDAPFLAPQVFRGQVCEPRMITETSAFLAQEFGITTEMTTANAQRILGVLP